MIKENLHTILQTLSENANLVAVSKTKPVAAIQEAYEAGQRDFGENYVQEMVDKHPQLPADIHWHFIGHLQSNKVKYIAPFVYLIHGVDSFKLLKEINKQAQKNDRVIDCLLQLHVAQEETKFGLDENELNALLSDPALAALKNIRVVGLMAMASNTEDVNQIRTEFKQVQNIFQQIQSRGDLPQNVQMQHISTGMSSDYQIAMECGSTLVRIGSAIFGEREYAR